jgi:hypothetical protein
MIRFSWLLAADGDATYHRLARLQSLTEGWQWLALLAIILAVLTYVVHMYRRDSVELRSGVAVLLVVLRLAALAGILFFFFDLEKGTERRLTKNSRAVVLLDTSQSMAIRDYDEQRQSLGPSRAELLANAFREQRILEQLNEQHDVKVERFSDSSTPEEIVSLIRPAALSDDGAADRAFEQEMARLVESRRIARVAGGLLLVALLCGAFYAWGAYQRGSRPAAGERGSWSLLAAMVLMISSLIVFAVAHLRNPDAPLLDIVGLTGRASNVVVVRSTPLASEGDEEEIPEVDWQTELAPRGQATRLGDALRHAVNQERGGPISGIVLVTDGQGNAGIDYSVATLAAQEAGIPVHTVGMGTDRPPINVRVVDLEAPQRVYPGDRFPLLGYIQSFGLAGRTVRVELYSALVDQSEEVADVFEEEKSVVLGEDGVPFPVEFEATPGEVGTRRYTLKVVPPEQDHDPSDNQRSANVEVVDQKNRVLLVAGGPTREYNFLRNLLFRDRDTISDVYLQTGQPGISQEADELLFDFPRTADELFAYDCIIAFDPDWLKLDETQLRLLERWVSEQAGGLVLIAGPVYHPEWTQMRRGADSRVDLLKSLYPVVFAGEGLSSVSLSRPAADRPRPLQFTRDGLGEKFLWLEEDAIRSEQIWSSFEGVYGHTPIRDVKSGARVYARASDPQASSSISDAPVYMAGHYYGSGRVFFLASGEMWRLRALDDKYFETFYTKLIRWISQGRLLRDSSRGVLLVDKERCFLGDQITVTAVLTDSQRQPLRATEVQASLIHPDRRRTPLTLQRIPDATREGEYQGQFSVVLEGDYRVELLAPEARGDELLTQEVRASSSLAEMRRPLRNDAVLQEIAEKTRGQFYIGMDEALGLSDSGKPPLTEVLAPQDQETILPGTPDRRFKELLSIWLLGLIAGVLSLEWLIRRLNKLA